MGKMIVVVNASPRTGWNTDTLLTEAAKGAESAGAKIIRFDLFIKSAGMVHSQSWFMEMYI